MKPPDCIIAVMFATVLLAAVPHALADCPYTEYGWTAAIGAEGFDQARGVGVGPDGAAYVIGSFEDTVDFDPSKRKDKFKAKGSSGYPDIYLTSYSREGSYRWTARMGGASHDFGDAVTVTRSGDVVLTGAFYEKGDFNPTKQRDKHQSRGAGDIFVTLLHPDGSYGWTRTFGGEGSDVGWAVAADNEGNIIVAGYFKLRVDFNPGRRVDKRRSNGGEDVFVTKLGPNGSYQWTRTFGGSLRDTAWGVATDADGNIIITGEYRGTVDFDPTKEGKDFHTSNGEDDVFITKLGSDGSYRWTHTFGGPSINDKGFGVVTDEKANVYVTGAFVGKVDFDERGGGDVRVAQGFSDIFVTKRAPDGSYLWTQTFGGEAIEAGVAIVFDGSHSLVITGNYSGTVDFDFTEGVDEHTAVGGRDVFVTRMTTEGGYVRTDSMGGGETDAGVGVAVHSDSSVVVVGSFRSVAADFDPTSGVDRRSSNGSKDFFITKHYCGRCEFVERHTVVGKRGKIISTVRALAPGGKVTVECSGPGEPVRKSAKISDDNTATLKFKNLPQCA